MRDRGEILATQQWAERDDGLVIHLREAAELREPVAGQGWPFTRADGAEQVASFGTRVAFLADGRLIERSRPDDLFASPQDDRTKRFLCRIIEAGRL